MALDYRIGALWIGGDLSFLEQLCLKSFVDAGHEVILYTYEGVTNAPQGVVQADASDILPQTGFLRHERTGSPALHSDIFRYHMLAKQDQMIWADTDAYCVKPFTTETGHYYAWESDHGLNGGVLGLPQDSATLAALLEFTREEFPVPEWYDDATKAKILRSHETGQPMHVSEMKWGVWGPHALTHFLKKTGEVEHALPMHVLYPFSYGDRQLMLRPGLDATQFVKPDTTSIHFYGRRMRARVLDREPGGIPRPQTVIGKLLKKHKIDPTLAPIKPRGTVELVDGDE
jgi:hypothetical protein